MPGAKIAVLLILGIAFLLSTGLTLIGVYTSDTVITVWNAVNMFVSAFFFGFICRT